jgi:hypothetical protein
MVVLNPPNFSQPAKGVTRLYEKRQALPSKGAMRTRSCIVQDSGQRWRKKGCDARWHLFPGWNAFKTLKTTSFWGKRRLGLPATSGMRMSGNIIMKKMKSPRLGIYCFLPLHQTCPEAGDGETCRCCVGFVSLAQHTEVQKVLTHLSCNSISPFPVRHSQAVALNHPVFPAFVSFVLN